jgi:hypothetical protein
MVNNGKRLAEQKKIKAADTPVVSVQQEVSKIEQRLATVEVAPTETQLTEKKSRAKKATISSKSVLRTGST